jgi:hypothetical protein
MLSVPTLAEVAQDRARLDGLPFGALWPLLLQAQGLQTAIACAMAPAMQRAVTAQGVTEDRLLTIAEAAERLHIHPATMKRKLRELPYNAAAVVLARNCVRVNAERLDEILRGGGLRARRKAVSA